MNQLIVPGNQVVRGSVQISGAKNGALPLLACAVLAQDTVKLSNVPNLSDIEVMTTLLKGVGAEVERNKTTKTLSISCGTISSSTIGNEAAKLRASVWFLAPLLARNKYVEMPMPGGCNIGDSASGARQIDMHLELLGAMGAKISTGDGKVIAEAEKLQGVNFSFRKVSVGATITAIMSCCTASGTSKLSGCAVEPEIVEICRFLNKIGAKIKGIGSRELEITGVERLSGTNFSVLPDRIEAGTYLTAAAITKGEIVLQGIDYNLLEAVCKALQTAGSTVEASDNSIYLKAGKNICATNITTQPFPGFITDMQAQFMSLMCLANGTSKITETIYSSRFKHALELKKMGADIFLDGPTATVKGVAKLHGAYVEATDLRASVCLLLAGLAAEGTTHITNVHHLRRGYEDLEAKLEGCGVKVYANTYVEDSKDSAFGLEGSTEAIAGA